MKINIVDRYSALGIPRPDLRTMCDGQCEGVGYYPSHLPGASIKEADAWIAAHRNEHYLSGRLRSFFAGRFRQAFEKCDGWHFIKCENCGGTGRIKGEPSVWGERKIKGE